MNKMRWLALVCGAMTMLAGALNAAAAPDLLTVYQRAAQSDPKLQAADAAYQAALQAKPQALAGLSPSLSASASVSRDYYDNRITGTGSTSDTHQWGLNLDQPLYHRDRFVQLRQADATIGQADAQLGAAQQDLILRVAQGYFGVLAATDGLTFAKAEQAAIGRQLEQARKRFKVGMIAITDVHEAKAAYDSSHASAIAAENAVANAKEALREITNVYYDDLATLGPHMPLVTPKPNNMTDWTNTAQDHNLLLKASEFAAKVAKQNVDLKRSGHYPTLDVVGNIGYYKGNLNGLFATRHYSGSLALQLNVPLYQGGLVSSQVRQAIQQYYEARDNENEQRRATLRETRDAFRGVLTGISQVQALKQAVISNQSALEATQAGFHVGTRTIVDVLLAESNLYKAKRDYAQSRYTYILNILKLKQAAGTLSLDDVKEINAWLQ